MDKKKEIKHLGIVLLCISLFFILNLFFFGFHTSSSGHFVAIGFSFHYDWTWASIIAIILFVIWFFIAFFYKEKNRFLLIVIIFILSLLGKQIFYIVDSDFGFYAQKEVSYLDENGVLTDLDEFNRLYEKHCSYEKGWNFKGNERANLCGGSDKYPEDFGSLETYKKALDYYNKISNRNLYSGAYNLSIKKFGLETMIEEYRDDTFYGRVIIYNNNEELFKKLIFFTDSIELNEILKYNLEKLKYFKKNQDNIKYNFWDIESNIINDKLHNTSTVNSLLIY